MRVRRAAGGAGKVVDISLCAETNVVHGAAGAMDLAQETAHAPQLCTRAHAYTHLVSLGLLIHGEDCRMHQPALPFLLEHVGT